MHINTEYKCLTTIINKIAILLGRGLKYKNDWRESTQAIAIEGYLSKNGLGGCVHSS